MTASPTEVSTTLLVIYTESLEQCRAFYQGLGLRFVSEQHGSGPHHWAAVLAGGMVLELYPAVADRVTRDVRLGFSVPVSAPDPRLPVGRHRRIDPDGRTVELEVH